MLVHYYDIECKDYKESHKKAIFFRQLAKKANEYLIIKCQSKFEGWEPECCIMVHSDAFILDGKVIKDRFGLVEK